MKFKLDIKNLLEYFDLRESTEKGDTTSVISVAGEDLNSAIFRSFREEEFKAKIKVFDDTPTLGKKKGKHLDRWIFEEKGKIKVLYQAEIKNWGARALGGSDVPLDVGAGELSELIKKHWNHFSDIDKKEVNGINKVFVKMDDYKVRKIIGKRKCTRVPLLIIWEVVHPKGKNKYFYRYKVNVNKKYFDFGYCDIFSCSLYLRCLRAKKIKKIEVEMPNVRRRLLDMNRLFPILK